MARSTLLPAVLSAALSLALPLSPARATFTAADNFSPSDSSAWTSSTIGYVGKTSGGTLTVDSGSSLLSGDGYVGHSSGVSGAVSADGSSMWTASGSFPPLQYGFQRTRSQNRWQFTVGGVDWADRGTAVHDGSIVSVWSSSSKKGA
jgi:hypothetical protein